MSNKLFSNKEIEQMQNNKFVKNVTPKAITFTDEQLIKKGFDNKK